MSGFAVSSMYLFSLKASLLLIKTSERIASHIIYILHLTQEHVQSSAEIKENVHTLLASELNKNNGVQI
jgi:hypothetical protein